MLLYRQPFCFIKKYSRLSLSQTLITETANLVKLIKGQCWFDRRSLQFSSFFSYLCLYDIGVACEKLLSYMTI